MCCLVSSRAFRRSPICCHCSGVHKITHIGALCSHGKTNNQHNSSTQPRTQTRTMTKKSPSVTAAERTWLTKPPYKRQKKSNVPVPAPQAKAPAAAPAPVPLVTADNAVAQAPVEKKSPPVLPAAPAVAPAPFLFGEPIHPSGIVVEIVELPGPLVRGARDLQ
jgi:hypothetical protein